MVNSNKLKEDNRIEIAYEQVLAAALLKFNKLDQVDIKLLVDELNKNKDVSIKYNYNLGHFYWLNTYFSFENGAEYRKDYSKDSTFVDYWKNDASKTSRLLKKLDQQTIEVLLKNITNDITIDLLDKINFEELKKYKESLIKKYKKEVLENAHILLISDKEEEYQPFIEYGFKNVDWFKSYVRADRYFKEHKDELKKYHTIIVGDNRVIKNSVNNKLSLNTSIGKLNSSREVLDISMCYIDKPRISLYNLRNDVFNINYSVETNDFTKAFDEIVNSMLLSDIMSKKKDNYKNIGIYLDKNKKSLPLPKKKEDLKILCAQSLNKEYRDKIQNEINQSLGLNITFIEDHNYAYDEYMMDQLGNYDIIIAEDPYSSCVSILENESIEQCKDTGRKMVLLTTANTWDTWDKTAEINLYYNYAIENQDNIKKDELRKHKKYRFALSDDIGENSKKIPYEEERKIVIKNMLQEVVYLYNDKLKEEYKTSISDLNFKRGSDYEKELLELENKIAEEKNKARLKFLEEIKPVEQVQRIEDIARNYIKYGKYIDFSLDNMEIKELKNGIEIDRFSGNRILCKIVLTNTPDDKERKIFTISTLSNKGSLSKPNLVGVYTSKWDNNDTMPRRINDAEQKVLDSIEKKLIKDIVPINETAIAKRTHSNKKRYYRKRFD